jgi:hypothetical protein
MTAKKVAEASTRPVRTAARLTNRPCHDKDMMRLLRELLGETVAAVLNAPKMEAIEA